MHWVQSLAHRGFTEKQIGDEVYHRMGFQVQNRPPPSREDVAHAIETMPKSWQEKGSKTENMSRSSEMEGSAGDTWRKASPDEDIWGSDVGDYERKGYQSGKKRGADAYDGPPPGNYVCNRCGEKGT